MDREISTKQGIRIARHAASSSLFAPVDWIKVGLEVRGKPHAWLDPIMARIRAASDDVYVELPEELDEDATTRIRNSAAKTVGAINAALKCRIPKGVPEIERSRVLAALKTAAPLFQQIADLDFTLSPERTRVNLNRILDEHFASNQYTDKHGRSVTVKILSGNDTDVCANENLVRRAVAELAADASIHPISKEPHLLVTTSRPAENKVLLRLTSIGAKPLSRKMITDIGRRQFSTREPDGTVDVHGMGKIDVRRIALALGGSLKAVNYPLNGKRHPALEFMLPAA